MSHCFHVVHSVSGRDRVGSGDRLEICWDSLRAVSTPADYEFSVISPMQFLRFKEMTFQFYP